MSVRKNCPYLLLPPLAIYRPLPVSTGLHQKRPSIRLSIGWETISQTSVAAAAVSHSFAEKRLELSTPSPPLPPPDVVPRVLHNCRLINQPPAAQNTTSNPPPLTHRRIPLPTPSRKLINFISFVLNFSGLPLPLALCVHTYVYIYMSLFSLGP